MIVKKEDLMDENEDRNVKKYLIDLEPSEIEDCL